MRRKRTFTLFISGLLLFLLACFILRDLQQAAWERLLISFPGEPFTGELQGSPASSLQFPDGYSLLLYQRGTNHPVLALQSPAGSNLWKQLLIPRDIASDGSVREGKIQHLQFKSVHQDQDRTKVYVSCHWYWGGDEGGIIYLRPDYSFERFALNW